MGDNRSGSIDSRNFGAVTKDDILGKVTNIFYPRIKRLLHNQSLRT